MSTLTSSQSPAASPRTLGYPLPSSPRRSNAFHTRSPLSPNSKQPPDQPIISRLPRREIRAEGNSPVIANISHYADAATQYSPIGSPPTSRRHIVIPSPIPPPPSSAGGGSAKRKEAARSQSPLTSQMSNSKDAIAYTGAASVDLESAAQPSSVNGPVITEPTRRVETEPVSEPQEARSTHGLSSAPKRSRPEPGETRIMPIKYETCNPKDLGVLIANMLMELIRLNDQIPLRDGRLTRFHSRAPPGISVSDYLQRLIQHATLSPPILLSMVYYIDRLCNMYSAFTINSLTVHRFLITAATVASKGLSDSFWTNPTYARIGGIPVSELATLELEFLQRVQWKIVPQPEVLEEYYRSLVERTEGFELEGDESETSSLDESEKADSVDKEDEEKESDTNMTTEPD